MKSIWAWYKRKSVRNDAIVSLVMAAALWSTGPYLAPFFSPDFSPTQLVATMVSVMAQFASISIAALAIVAGVVDSKYLNEIRTLKWFPNIWRFLAITGCVFVGGITLGLATMFFGVQSYIAFGFLTVSVFLFVQVYRCIRLLYMLISIINSDRQQRP